LTPSVEKSSQSGRISGGYRQKCAGFSTGSETVLALLPDWFQPGFFQPKPQIEPGGRANHITANQKIYQLIKNLPCAIV